MSSTVMSRIKEKITSAVFKHFLLTNAFGCVTIPFALKKALRILSETLRLGRPRRVKIRGQS